MASNLTVGAGPTGVWTLEAGAQLRMPASSYLMVSDGHMRALGTPSDPVVFTSDLQPAVAGRWSYLMLHANGDPSELHHVRIEGAGSANQPSLTVSTDSVLDHVSVGVRAAIGIQLSSVTAASFVGGTVEAGPGVGVNLNTSSVTLDGWNIASTAPALGVSTVGNSSLTLLNSTVSGGIKLNPGSLTLRDSIVRDSAGIGLECNATSGAVRVSGTQFINNATVGISWLAPRFTRNTISGSPVGIRLTSRSAAAAQQQLAGIAAPLQNQDTLQASTRGSTGGERQPRGLVSGSRPPTVARLAFVGPFEVGDAVTTPERFVPVSNTLASAPAPKRGWSLAVSNPALTVVRSFSGTASSSRSRGRATIRTASRSRRDVYMRSTQAARAAPPRPWWAR
jgi:hypothetical protein